MAGFFFTTGVHMGMNYRCRKGGGASREESTHSYGTQFGTSTAEQGRARAAGGGRHSIIASTAAAGTAAGFAPPLHRRRMGAAASPPSTCISRIAASAARIFFTFFLVSASLTLTPWARQGGEAGRREASAGRPAPAQSQAANLVPADYWAEENWAAKGGGGRCSPE